MMRTFIYRCPATGFNVQGEHDSGALPVPAYVLQDCLACRSFHLVDPQTGRLMADEVPRPKPPKF